VLTLPGLRRYLYAKSKKGARPRTIRSAFNPLRGLSSFLVDHGLLEEASAKTLSLPKLDAASRLTVTNEQISALFEACERQPTQRQVALYRAVLSVLCYAGLTTSIQCQPRRRWNTR
jgi:site-specific recombinase XerD